jgi:hypothetical protein
MEKSAATTPVITLRGVVIFAAVSSAVLGFLWSASERGRVAREEFNRLTASEVDKESEAFCAKYVTALSGRPACVTDLQAVRDSQSRRLLDQDGML